MPIAAGGTSAGWAVPNLGRQNMFYQPVRQPQQYVLSGTTIDTNGNPLAGCLVKVFTNQTPPTVCGQAVSDASGNFSVDLSLFQNMGFLFQVVAYLPGSPDVAGVSVNTLTATAA